LLTFSFGPAFFALINTGIKHGYKTGSLLAVGVVCSDLLVCLLIILLVHLGASNFIQDEKSQRFMGIIAGIVLIVFGAFHFRQPLPTSTESAAISAPSGLYMITKGFLLNSLNPAVWLLWLANVAAVSKTMKYSIVKMIIYFSVTLGIVLLVEMAKVAASEKLKKVLTPKLMYLINSVTVILLIIFGLVLIYNHYFEQT
jgi:threonine/homoserine/homoserine lactone efflux protein